MSGELSITEKRRIVIAYDGSEDARKLFDWSVKNIINPKTDHIILVNAMPRWSHSGHRRNSTGKELPMLTTTPTRVNEAIEQLDTSQPQGQTVRQLLESMANQLRSLNISSEQHILWGEAKDVLPKYTQSQPTHLLIVGSRGLSTVKSVLVGSVSEKCIKECPCPVLVVRNAII
ncbi:hypothetical protein BJ944DRAFT_268826 [Cunninghamella echinulata]|nr:hypothetical protein BJ944DRAFT_268826 [Cunninghamella echinulata]